MAHESTTTPSCLSRLFGGVRFNGLTHSSSLTFSTPVRAIAQISAASLVLASCGLGGFYAWSVGAHHGALLAVLFVIFAIGLELAKPLSVVAALAALRSFAVVRGAALGLLALVAVAYSLTAELSLMAMSRGDVVAQREAALKATADAEAAARRASERYDRAKAELVSLPATRPTTELQAEIDGLLLRPGANGCVAIDGRVTREVCPKVAELRAEKARAERRNELEQILAAPLPPAVGASSGPAVSKPDPAASALAAYLAVLGIIVTPAVLSEWLVLVPVLALEIGSTFAVLLTQSVGAPVGVVTTRNREGKLTGHELPEPAPMVQVVQADEQAASGTAPSVREEVKNRILTQLKASGGSKVSSERGLAKLIGTSKPTARRALQSLVLAGVVAAEAGRNGTLLRLVA